VIGIIILVSPLVYPLVIRFGSPKLPLPLIPLACHPLRFGSRRGELAAEAGEGVGGLIHDMCVGPSAPIRAVIESATRQDKAYL
jgi:hypothetical protein